MAVCTSFEDRTWQAHLNGLMAVLDTDDNPSRPIDPTATPIDKAGAILTIVMKDLKDIVGQVSTSADNIATMRQLDVVKLRSDVKRLYRDLSAVPSLLSLPSDPISLRISLRWIEYWVLTIILATLLLRTRSRAYPSMRPDESPETVKLSSQVEAMTSVIIASAEHLFNDSNAVGKSTDRDRMLSIVWPLYAVLKLSSIMEDEREQVLHLLSRLGENMIMPLAYSLVSLLIYGSYRY